MVSPLSNKRLCVTGGAGFLGRAVCAKLSERGVSNVFVPRSSEYDLTRAEAVVRLFDECRPDIVILDEVWPGKPAGRELRGGVASREGLTLREAAYAVMCSFLPIHAAKQLDLL